MSRKSTEEQLKALAQIGPDPVFLKWSRKAIMVEAMRTAPETRPARAREWTLAGAFLRHRRYAASAAGAFAVAIMVFMAPAGSPATSLNGAAIAAERRTIAAENNTAEVRYFKGISPAVSIALKDIIDPRSDYGSTNHIRKGIALLSKGN